MPLVIPLIRGIFLWVNPLNLYLNNILRYGESFASISAVARITDKSKQSISDYVNGRLQGVTKMELKTAEIQTPGGLQGVTLLNEQQIAQVIKHYKPELLKRWWFQF
jgi:hypothetical protein